MPAATPATSVTYTPLIPPSRKNTKRSDKKLPPTKLDKKPELTTDGIASRLDVEQVHGSELVIAMPIQALSR